MSKHTPGPWRWGDGQRGLYGQGEGRQREVLTFEPYEGMWLSYTDHQEANARLIEAAPLMYEALESLDTILEFACGVRENEAFVPQDPSLLNAAFERARAALQAAKGGGDV